MNPRSNFLFPNEKLNENLNEYEIYSNTEINSNKYSSNSQQNDTQLISKKYSKYKFDDFAKRYPKLNEQEIYRLIHFENSFQKLAKLSKFKLSTHVADGFYLLESLNKKRKHQRLKAMFLYKIINSIFNKNVEGFFMVYKKNKFFEDTDLHKQVLKGPLKTMGRFWGTKVYNHLNKLRIFKNIVNNYEYHIQPFQKRSIKNNIIGLLKEMQLNNHKNQQIMLKDPYSLKNNLLCLITSNLIKGKNEGFIEEFFRLIKANNRNLNDVGNKLKRFDFLMRGMVRNRYALFFRDFVIHDKSVMDENKSNLSKISKITRNQVPYKRMIQRHNTQSNLKPILFKARHGSLDKHNTEFRDALSFENNNMNNNFTDSKHFIKYEDEDSNKVITSFVQNEPNSPLDEISLINSQLLNQYSNINSIPKSIWKNNPNLHLPFLLHSLISKHKKEVFDDIKISNLLKTFSKNKKNNDMTKSFINLKTKLKNESNLPMKLFATLLEKIISHKIYMTKKSVIKRLKKKEIKVFKVLFGKVTPIKQNNASVVGDSLSNLAENFNKKSIMNSQSFLNFPKKSHFDHFSNCKKYIFFNYF